MAVNEPGERSGVEALCQILIRLTMHKESLVIFQLPAFSFLILGLRMGALDIRAATTMAAMTLTSHRCRCNPVGETGNSAGDTP